VVGVAGLSAAFCAADYLLFVRTAWGQRLDDAALAGRGSLPPLLLQGVLNLLGTIQLGTVGVALVAVTALGTRRGGWPLGIAAGGIIGGAVATVEALKRTVLSRPALLGAPDPSGSATASRVAMRARRPIPGGLSPATLDGVWSETVYFADRPARLAGTVRRRARCGIG
jgi:hypothetical protein